VTPGAGFGPHGEGYVRVALTLEETRLGEALERIRRVCRHR
jgi:aspartate/methionine/tyrosine aminotransferase